MKVFMFFQYEGREIPLGPNEDGVYPLDEMTIVGRKGDIKTPERTTKVSRYHLILAMGPDLQLRVVDVSRYGTLLNGREIQYRGAQSLKVGDILALQGEIRLRIIS